MLKNIYTTLLQIWTRLNRTGKLVVVGVIALVAMIPVLVVLTRQSSQITQQQETSLASLREQIEKLGNPFEIPKTQILTQYPYIVNKKLKDGLTRNVYLIDVNTTMLQQDKYNALFESANSIKDSLASKPFMYTDQYQMLYDIETSQPINPNARMLNFHEVNINGFEKWFSEEDGDFWVSDPTTEATNLKKLNVNKTQLPAFQKLQKIGPNKFFWSTKNFEQASMNYNTFEIFADNSTRVNSGVQDFTFIEVPATPNDPKFIGSFTSGDLLPQNYAINKTYLLNKSSTTEEAIITFTNINDITNPKRVTDKQIKIREVKTVFITCNSNEEKCWIFNPGIKSLKEINSKLDIVDFKPSRDIDLTKISEDYATLFDKDRMLRYNEESKELLFFYENSWKSIYRY